MNLKKYIQFTKHFNLFNYYATNKYNLLYKTCKFPFCNENKKEENKSDNQVIKFKFIYLSNKSEVEAEGKEGESILEIAHKYDVNLEGACDASLACSTCHVILDQKIYDKLPAPIEEEEDLLDLAFGLTHTSRLGCQVKIDKSFKDTIIYIPAATRNFYAEGQSPKSTKK